MTPINDFRFIDLEAVIGACDETRTIADRTVNVEHDRAASANEVMVVVANSVFITCRRSGRLDSANKTLFGHNRQAVVDRLTRDRTDLGYGSIMYFVSCRVGLSGDRLEDRYALRRDV